jgi:pimeloyl-[acyl-carrier protein] methyl ester esterase
MNRPTVTLLHGWGYSPKLWRDLTPRLDAFECHTPELQAPCSDIESWVDAMAGRLPDAGLLVGWSLGAMLALCMASRYPAKVRGLLLIAGSPHMRSEADWGCGLDAALLEKFRTGFRQAPERMMRRFLAMQLVGEAQPQQARQLLESALCDAGTSREALERGLEILFSADLRKATLVPDLPLTLVHGRADEIMPVAGSEWLHQQYPASQLLIVENAGHAPLLAEPEKLAELIRALHDAA